MSQTTWADETVCGIDFTLAVGERLETSLCGFQHLQEEWIDVDEAIDVSTKFTCEPGM